MSSGTYTAAIQRGCQEALGVVSPHERNREPVGSYSGLKKSLHPLAVWGTWSNGFGLPQTVQIWSPWRPLAPSEMAPQIPTIRAALQVHMSWGGSSSRVTPRTTIWNGNSGCYSNGWSTTVAPGNRRQIISGWTWRIFLSGCFLCASRAWASVPTCKSEMVLE